MIWLAAVLHIDPEILRGLTAIFSLIAAVASAGAAIAAFLHRAAGKRTEQNTADTRIAVDALVAVLGTQKTNHDALWAAYIAKDTVANPDGVRRIARETCDEELQPMRSFFAAVETVESRRTHRPETDLIQILEGAS